MRRSQAAPWSMSHWVTSFGPSSQGEIANLASLAQGFGESGALENLQMLDDGLARDARGLR